MNIKYDSLNRIEPSNIYLANVDDDVLCSLNSIRPESVSLTINVNNMYDLKFTIDETICIDDQNTPANGYDLVGNLMHLYVDNIGWFRMGEPESTNNGFNESKTIHAESIDCELVDNDLFGFKTNYGTTDSYEMLIDGNVEIDDTGIEHSLSQIKFYNGENHDLSLMHIPLKAAGIKGWNIGYVDASIKEYKSYDGGVETKYSVSLHDEIGYFDISTQSVYAFYTQDMAKFFECIIEFDIKDRLINAYRIETYGKDTNVTVGFRNLENSNVISVDDKSIFTRYRVSGGDELGIEYVNFGSNIIENISFYLNRKYLSENLIVTYKLWYDYMLSKRIEYATFSRLYNTQLETISELRNRLPLDDTETDWATFPLEDLQARLLDYQAQQLGIETLFTDVDDNVDWTRLWSSELADTYYQIVTYIISNLQIAISNKYATTQDDIEEYRKVENWKLYGSDELDAKLKMFTGQRETYIKNGYNTPYTDSNGHSKDYHDKCYADFLWLENQINPNFVDSCAMEHEKRLGEVASAEVLLEQFSVGRKAIYDSVQKEFWSYTDDNGVSYSFTDNDLKSLSRLYVDTDYQNPNMFLVQSDNQITAIDEQLKLLQAAEEDLDATSQPQYKCSTTLDNFIAIFDYKDYVQNLELGDFIRLGIRDNYYTSLRFISLTYNPVAYDNEITIEFSNMVKSSSKRNDFAQLLDIASQSGKNAIQGGSNNFGNNSGEIGTASLRYILNKIVNSNTFRDAVNSNINQQVGGWIGSASGNVKITEEGLIECVDLMAENGFFQYLYAGLISTDTIYANNATINILDVLYAKIRDMVVSTSVTETGVIYNLKVGNTEIDSAVIKNLIAAKISVADLMAHVASAEVIKLISSTTGEPTIAFKDSTQQFYDSDGHVRVQIGQDGNGDFNFIVRGEDGTTALFDENGIKQAGIPNGTIINNMIENDTISRGKLNFPIIETDENGHISITNVYDGDQQYGTKITKYIDDSISGVESMVDGVNQQITDKVWQTDIITAIDGVEEVINTKYTEVNQTVDRISSEVRTIETTTETLTDRVATVEQTTEGFQQLVSDTKTTLEGQIESVESSFTQHADTIENLVSDINGNVTSLTADLIGVESRVANTEGDIASLNTTATEIRGELSSIDGNVNTISSKADEMEIKLTDAEGNISSLEQRADEFELNISKRQDVTFRYIRDCLNCNNFDNFNRFVECQIYAEGENISHGKIPIPKDDVGNVLITTSNLSWYTDGDIASSNYIELVSPNTPVPFDNTWVFLELDLGKIYQNVDTIQIWHDYDVAKSYRHKLQVSIDGVIWKTLYTSEFQGGYMETIDGKLYNISDNAVNNKIASLRANVDSISANVTMNSQQLDLHSIYTHDQITHAAAARAELLVQLNNISTQVQQLDNNGNYYSSLITQNSKEWKALFRQIGMGGAYEKDEQYVPTSVSMSANGMVIDGGDGRRTIISKDRFAGEYNKETVFQLTNDLTITRRLQVENGVDFAKIGIDGRNLTGIKYLPTDIVSNGQTYRCLAHIRSGGSS